MATGRLGHTDLAAGTNTSLYTVPANTFGIVTLSICNRGNSAISVRVAVASAGTPLASEYIEYDVEILAKAYPSFDFSSCEDNNESSLIGCFTFFG